MTLPGRAYGWAGWTVDRQGVEKSRHLAHSLLTQLLRLNGYATMLITMGGDECPYVPGLAREDWLLTDPKDRPLDEVRKIRDEIHQRVSVLLHAHHWTME